jgi:hypothetical protein
VLIPIDLKTLATTGQPAAGVSVAGGGGESLGRILGRDLGVSSMG